ncbi:MAG: hypothetical protein FWD58_06245 [Firmicutes bacterium]|nr:hypothetical protein [Bacillota bacterium]
MNKFEIGLRVRVLTYEEIVARGTAGEFGAVHAPSAHQGEPSFVKPLVEYCGQEFFIDALSGACVLRGGWRIAPWMCELANDSSGQTIDNWEDMILNGVSA